MTCKWLLFAILVAIVENAVEVAQENASDVVTVETSSVPYDLRETAAETSTFTAETSTSAAEISTFTAETSTSAAEISTSAAETSTFTAETSTSAAEISTSAVETSTFAAETSLNTATDSKETNAVDELRNRVVQQTNELNKANATLALAEERERRLGVLEREKYGHMKALQDKLMCLLENVHYTDSGLSDDASLFRKPSTCWTFEQSSRRLYALRKLLAGVNLGLVQMQSIRKLNESKKNKHQPAEGLLSTF